MMKIYNGITELVGKTPLIDFNFGTKASIICKAESFNPGGSAKDRVALYMIEDAEKRGLLKKGGTIVEPTSGNTGIGLASIAAQKGYKVIITMPDTMSMERRMILAAYGAQLVLTEGSKGMPGAIEMAEKLVREIEGAFMPSQFENPVNPKSHRETTGPEIWEDTDGKVDIFIATIGSGGTISGTGEFLKSMKPSVQVIGVEPAGSPVLTEGRSGSHKIQGIGAGFIPKNLNTKILDEVITIEDEEAIDEGRKMAKEKGLLVGISSGAAIAAALKVAEREENNGKMIVALLPDTGERYLSSEMFQ
ncbi:MAG: cysteine synthase A [Bacillota bacterium]|nr:cysteine synthase A [Bacillota bacterium]